MSFPNFNCIDWSATLRNVLVQEIDKMRLDIFVPCSLTMQAFSLVWEYESIFKAKKEMEIYDNLTT